MAQSTSPVPGKLAASVIAADQKLRTATLSYVYDFGDYWDHRITIEKTHAGDPLMTLPFCIGGAGGYAELDSWDPRAFDSAEANDRLAAIRL